MKIPQWSVLQGRFSPSDQINFLFLELCDDQNQIIKALPIRKSAILGWCFSFNYLQHFQRLESKQAIQAAYCSEVLINSNDNCRACVAILGSNYTAYVRILVWVKSGVGKKPLVAEYIFIHLLLKLDFIREGNLLSALRALNIPRSSCCAHSGQTQPGLVLGFILKKQNWSLCSAFQESSQMGTQILNFPWKYMSLEWIHAVGRSINYF